jgi:hypothetical protein
MPHRLLVETPDFGSFTYIKEEKNLRDGKGPRLYIEGPFMMANEVNKNRRLYDLMEMVSEVKRYSDEMIMSGRALGELNHPTTVDIDLSRACHSVQNLRQEGNYFVGKSLVLSTPMGKIVQNLIDDGVTPGVSTRCLGQLEPDSIKEDVNRVKNMKLVAIDVVADPSCPKAFVNGILESKQWILSDTGDLEEAYNKFEKSIGNLPRKDVDKYLREQVLIFINKLK